MKDNLTGLTAVQLNRCSPTLNVLKDLLCVADKGDGGVSEAEERPRLRLEVDAVEAV